VQRDFGTFEMGSVRPCGGAEQTLTLVRSECRLSPLLGDLIVAAAEVQTEPVILVQFIRVSADYFYNASE
jgi:hypothetical protein